MSYYVGYGGQVVVREEFRDLIESKKLDFENTEDPVFLLFKNLDPEDRLNYWRLKWERWDFDRESGRWDFNAEYNCRHHGDPLYTLMEFFLPYISEEIIEITEFDEEAKPYHVVSDNWKVALQQRIVRREEIIQEICDELESYYYNIGPQVHKSS